LVKPEWEETGLGHARKYYTLTANGRCQAVAMARLWSTFTGNIDLLLTPLQSE
jgi:DNA-binding PadR family transcriptional regulator